MVEKSKQVSATHLERLKQLDGAAKNLLLEKRLLSNEVVLLRGRIQAMQDELRATEDVGV